MYSIAATSSGFRAQLRRDRDRLRFRAAHDQRDTTQRPALDAKSGIRDDAKGPFGADKQIDQVEARLREIAGRYFRKCRYVVGGNVQADQSAPDGVDFDDAFIRGAHVAARNVQDRPVRQYDRQARDPVACDTVFESGGPGGVGGDGAAHERAIEGRHRRIVKVARREEPLQVRERNAGTDANGVGRWLRDVGQTARAEHDVTSGCRATRQRRLRADRQDTSRGADDGYDFGDVARKHHSLRRTARHMSRIAQE